MYVYSLSEWEVNELNAVVGHVLYTRYLLACSVINTVAYFGDGSGLRRTLRLCSAGPILGNPIECAVSTGAECICPHMSGPTRSVGLCSCLSLYVLDWLRMTYVLVIGPIPTYVISPPVQISASMVVLVRTKVNLVLFQFRVLGHFRLAQRSMTCHPAVRVHQSPKSH
jgi:hypothetical protein